MELLCKQTEKKFLNECRRGVMSKQGRNLLLNISIPDNIDQNNFIKNIVESVKHCAVFQKGYVKENIVKMCIQTLKKVTISKVQKVLSEFQLLSINFISLDKLQEFPTQENKSLIYEKTFTHGKSFGRGASFHKSKGALDTMLSKYNDLGQNYAVFEKWLYEPEQVILSASEQSFKDYLRKKKRFENAELQEKTARQWLTSTKLFPWQNTLMKYLKQSPSDREILFVYDPHGNSGKTTFQTKFQEAYRHDVLCLDSQNSDSMAFIVKNLTQATINTIFIDIPRADNNIAVNHKNKHVMNFQMFEKIKNGQFDSSKYCASRVYIQKVHLIVFTNFFPTNAGSCLTGDRWKIIFVHFNPEKIYKLKADFWNKNNIFDEYFLPNFENCKNIAWTIQEENT